jgi:hypothetical protein
LTIKKIAPRAIRCCTFARALKAVTPPGGFIWIQKSSYESILLLSCVVYQGISVKSTSAKRNRNDDEEEEEEEE